MSAVDLQKQYEDSQMILAPFGLQPAINPGRVFYSRLISVANMIREIYPSSSYDHRPETPLCDRDVPFVHTEEFRRGYAAFKHVVSAVLRPKTICEIGIGTGVSALAFLAGSPEAQYYGIDNGSKSEEAGGGLIEHVKERMTAHGYAHTIQIVDSMHLPLAPRADLFHVDGSHDFDHAMNDTKLAFASGSEWILIDDSRDPTVAAAAMLAAKMSGTMFHWTNFEDTWTGSILIHRVGG